MDADLRRRIDEAAAAKAEAEAAQARAAARKETAEADEAAAAARRAQLTALVPDFSKVETGALDVKEDDSPLWSTYLLAYTLGIAARDVAGALPTTDAPRRILVTSNPDLASGDAVYLDVRTGLNELDDAAEKLITAVDAGDARTLGLALDAAGAVAAAVPAVLSLFAAKRTLSTAALTPTDVAACAAVAGALKVARTTDTIFHDDFRLVAGDTTISVLLESVADRQQQLVGRKITLGKEKGTLEEQRVNAQAELDVLRKAATPDQAQIDAKSKEIAELQRKLSGVDGRLGMVASLLDAIAAYLTTIRTPAGGQRSPLATAALHAQLHVADTSGFTHVLLVKAQAGQAQQELDDRPLWLRDKFSVTADVSLTYILIETKTSSIVAAGAKTASRTAHGSIGDKPDID